MVETPEPLSPELKRLSNKIAKKRLTAPEVRYEANKDGSYTLLIGAENGPEELARLMEALGIYDALMMSEFLSQVSNSVSVKNKFVELNTNFALGFVKSIEPRNEVEAALAAQMAATHVCMLDSSRRFLWTDSLAGKDSAERAMNRFGRTFAAQMDALKRYRQTAQQTVRVERVTVNEGGQAIVGNVERGGGA